MYRMITNKKSKKNLNFPDKTESDAASAADMALPDEHIFGFSYLKFKHKTMLSNSIDNKREWKSI